ncbi:MAG: hypothetical protein JW929_11305 [Anaerolineales bacterium]|nr:hypothetical protein [Anaerolineales bacterium]
MTAAWTFPDPLRSRLLTPLSRWALARIARMYGFTLMPPMPPRPEDAGARADSVRRILRLARRSRPDIALAPEGMDSPDGRLKPPPSGAGRFIAHLAALGYTPVPVGAYETDGAFCLRFGEPFRLPQTDAVFKTGSVFAPSGERVSGFREAEDRDRETDRIVMEKIAELLPPNLQSPDPFPPSLKGRGKGEKG